jgi:hypothetical protein
MPTLLEDIHTQAAWIVKAFKADGLTLDHSIESFKAIDHFIDLHSADGKGKPGGRLETNWGPILWSIGAYVGETIIRHCPGGKWVTNDSDPQGELNVEVRLPNGTTMFPIARVLKRFQHGPEECIYDYGVVTVQTISKDGYWEQFTPKPKRPWWKFW